MATFYDRFAESAQRWPNNPALQIQRAEQLESYTFGEARRMAESVGRWLTEQHLEPGTRIAILADNHPRWVACYLGIIAAGHTAVPLDTAYHADQVEKVLKDSGAKLIFADVKHLAVTQKAVESLPVKIGLTDPSSLKNLKKEPGEPRWMVDLDAVFAAGPGNFKPVDAPTDAIAGLLYTSGTTADPKGVMLTHGNLLGEANAVFQVIKVGPSDAVLGILPMFHVLAQMANLMLPLVNGARVVYLETLNTTELLRALQEREITCFAVVPQFFYLIHEKIFKEVAKRGAIAKSALSAMMATNRFLRKLGINAGKLFFGKIHNTFGKKMRYLITGGSRFDPAIARDFAAFGIDIMNAYGLTETSAAACMNPPGKIVIGSVGPPFPTIEGKIDNPQPSEDGGPAVGEILLRGPIVMKGYWNRPEATAEALKDGWLHTGDLGYFDSGGNLFITGRAKELIVLANGKNLYPEEIEAHYLKSPYIKEICVMALEAKPGDPTSERLYAVVVPNFEELKAKKIVNAKEVIRFDIESLSQQLASTKRIGAYEIWQEDLPRTTTRKLKRFQIEKKVRANQAKGGGGEDADIPSERPLTPEDQEWLEREDVQRALAIIKENASKAPEKLSPYDNLELDLGLDSMQRVELLSGLEAELGSSVEESRLAEIYTVRDLVNAVLENVGKGGGAREKFAGWSTVFAEPVTDPDVLDLAKRRPFAEVFWFGVSRLIRVIAQEFFHLEYEGLEKLPKSGAYILSSNHQSYIDPAVLAGILPWRIFIRLFAVGTSEIFGSGFMHMLARWVRVVVVDPDAHLLPAMKAGAFGLKHGRVLILYPEGERSIDGAPKIFKKGAAILSVHLQVPIVPIAIDGFYEAWPRGKKFFQKLTRLKMKIGDPVQPPPESEASEETYANFTAEVKDRVVAMWEELHDGKKPGQQAKAAD